MSKGLQLSGPCPGIIHSLSQGSEGSLTIGALKASGLDVGSIAGTERGDSGAALGGTAAGIDPGTVERGAQAGGIGWVRGAGFDTLACGHGLKRGLQAEGAGCWVRLGRDSGKESDSGEDGEFHDCENGCWRRAKRK